MKMPRNINIEMVKKELIKANRNLSIHSSTDCLAVACFLHDAYHNCRLVYEDMENSDPFAKITECQYTVFHRMIRLFLRNEPYNFDEDDFQELYRYILAFSGALMGSVALSRLEEYRSGKVLAL